MRIAALWIRNNPFLGNIDLDFRGSDGRAMRHVVIAGANGCGKTAILEIIQAILGNVGTHWSSAPTEAYAFIEDHVPPKPDNIGYPMPPEGLRAIAQQFREANPQFPGLVLSLANQHATLPIVETFPLQKQQLLGTTLPSFYSDARVSFDVADVDRPSPLLEEFPEAYPGQRLSSIATISNQNLGNELAQLLVNLKVADDEDTTRWVAEHRGQGQEVPDDIFERRLRRFRDAFSAMMPHKHFRGVIRVNGKYQVVFEEQGSIVSLGRLSTGEKQIVLRGGFLLRNYEYLPGAVILIDEPELGLHPSWQERILGYYDRIAPEDPEQTGQIIVATHSPFVVHGSPGAKHVVLKRDAGTGRIEVDRSLLYPGVTPEAVAITAFEISSLISTTPGNRMVVATEGKTDAQMIRAAWEKLRLDRPMPFDLMPGGSAGSLRQFLGHEANAPGPLADMMASRGVDRVLGLFDFDKEGHGYWNKGRKPPANIAEQDLTLATCPWWRRHGTNVWSALLPVPNHRPTAADLGDGAEASILTTELLFEDAYLRGMVRAVQVRHAPAGVTRPEASNAQKSQIAEAARQFPPEAFTPFEPLLALIERVLQTQL